MASNKRRRQVAWEAARLMCYREESEQFRARWRAALRIFGGDLKPSDLPGSREIREQIARIEESLQRDAAELGLEQARCGTEPGDRFRRYHTLLSPLEHVHENRKSHPEGDVLYHSLQVFELGRRELPYDEEFLLSALLHDVGKAIDPKDHVAAALAALDGAITPRTAWLIEHHLEAQALYEGRLGVRSRRRLQSAESFEEVVLLADCDRKGRLRGVPVPDVGDALEYLRQLAERCDP